MTALRSTPHAYHVATFVAEFNAEWNRLQGEASAHEGAKRRELDAVGRKLDGLIDAIARGIRSTSLQQKLDELEARKAELERALQAAPRPRPLLHPRLADVYRQRVESLHTAFDGSDGSAALETLRSLIERVVLHPAPDGQRGFEIELIGEIAAMVALGADDKDRARSRGAGHDAFHSSIKVVAGHATNATHLTCSVPVEFRRSILEGHYFHGYRKCAGFRRLLE